MKRNIIIGIVILIILFLLVWLFIISIKPLPGIEAKQDGREHVSEDSAVSYNFNPPTGGDHYASWITKGFYEEPRHDGNLVHSLEHGYIIFWYDCEKQLAIENGILTVLAHEEQATDSAELEKIPMTGGSEGIVHTKLSDLPKAFSDGSCEQLRNELRNTQEQDPHKIIVMPRIGMDNKIILTAWGRMLKLDAFDGKPIKEFISAFRDNGPEATNEP